MHSTRAVAAAILLLSVGAASANPAPANAVAPATQPANASPAAQAEPRKAFDERWRQVHVSQLNGIRTQWANAPVVQTFKPGTLVQLSLCNGVLKAHTTDLAAATAVRVAVEGTKSIWMLSRSQGMGAAGGGFPRPTFTPYVNISRYDLDAKDADFWNSRLMVSERTVSFYAQTLYGNTSLSQSGGVTRVRVSEYTQWGQPQKSVFVAQASSLTRLRAENPEPFRLYVLPLLARFSDPSFLQPGPADVYGVFPEIAAEQKIAEDLTQLVPELDAIDPIDREAASEKLRQLGAPGVLAALRLDESELSEEQKLRVRSFISAYRRRPTIDPAIERRDLSFLIDCLEFDDPSVRAAAKAEIERVADKHIELDTSLTGDTAATAVDALRRRLLAPPQSAPPTTLPAGSPAPQVVGERGNSAVRIWWITLISKFRVTSVILRYSEGSTH